jgi:predicted nucleic acid-binding protein
VYLFDTNLISEARKGSKADPGVRAFRRQVKAEDDYLPVQAIGELRRGVESLKHRGDLPQAAILEAWLANLLEEYDERILAFDAECAQVWGKIMSPSGQNPVDKQVAAIALVHDLTVVTRNISHFTGTGVKLLNPFTLGAPTAAPHPSVRPMK